MTELSDGFTIRFYREGDEEAMLALLREAFGRWPAVDICVDPIEHLRWKLRSHKQALRFHIVAEDAGTIVGGRASRVQRINVAGTPRLARLAQDLCVHPSYQDRGVALRMLEFMREQFEATFAFQLEFGSGHPAIQRLGARKRSLYPRNKLDVLVRALDGEVVPRRPPSATVREVSAFDERIDAFFRQASVPFDFIVVRSQDYLNWRYCDQRAGRFAVRLAEEHGQITGYAVLRLTRGRAFIADLLALPGRLDIVRTLVETAIAWARQATVPRLECWLPAGHPYVDVLRAHGFESKRTRELALRLLRMPREDLAFLEDPRARVHVTVGDSDIV